MNIKSLALFAVSIVFLPLSASAADPATNWEYIRDASGKSFGHSITKDASYDDDDLTSIYRLRKGILTDHLKTSDKIAPADQAIWDLFTLVADKELIQKRLLVFGTFENSNESTLAYVKKLGKKKQTWLLGVNANAARPESDVWKREMAIILVHEYGHLVTFDDAQFNKRMSAQKCSKAKGVHVQRHGCAIATSYIAEFTKEFWTSGEIKAAFEAEEKGKIKDIYNKHKADYVTWYAATNPLEDIAESFTDFILTNKPAGLTEKEKKILFFYQYPELVQMRETVRANIAVYF